MIVRTWRQGSTLMASAMDAPLDAEALDLVSAHARKRWPDLGDAPGILLADDVDEDARALVRERPELIGDIRQVDGLSSGWALAWIDPDALAERS
jgi:hypothetical protein